MFRTVPLSIIRSFSLYTQQSYVSYRFADSVLLASCQQTCIHIPLLCVQWKTPDDGQRNCPKHVEFYSKKKFEKLVHLVGFIIRIYHKARSPERLYFCVCTFTFHKIMNGRRDWTWLRVLLFVDHKIDSNWILTPVITCSYLLTHFCACKSGRYRCQKHAILSPNCSLVGHQPPVRQLQSCWTPA